MPKSTNDFLPFNYIWFILLCTAAKKNTMTMTTLTITGMSFDARFTFYGFFSRFISLLFFNVKLIDWFARFRAAFCQLNTGCCHQRRIIKEKFPYVSLEPKKEICLLAHFSNNFIFFHCINAHTTVYVSVLTRLTHLVCELCAVIDSSIIVLLTIQ